jgi:hypothetical protein
MTRTPQATALNPLGSDFDRFLYADVGADRHGGLLSVISALARLGLDPWEQAAMLARMPVDAAIRALSALLAGLPATTVAGADTVPLATRLVMLLPRAPRRAEQVADRAATGGINKVPRHRLKLLLIAVFILVALGVQRLVGH